MLIRHIKALSSPLTPGRVRLQCEALFDAAGSDPEIYWFDVPQDIARDLSDSGNPWLALFLPLAVQMGEPLHVHGTVDEELFANVHELMRVWACWHPRLRPVRIEAPLGDPNPHRGAMTASLFSGGIDAWFTLLSNNTGGVPQAGHRIDELICVWGLDVALDKPAEFQAMSGILNEAVRAFGVPLVEVATNLRQTHWWRKADWGPIGHGCALASIGLMLERRYRSLLIPSTYSYAHLAPWGSHPLTDPLLSTSRTRIIHDGAAFSRAEKTRVVSESPEALASLQVCWATGCFRNCGKCAKCYRTMATLEVLGKLEDCPRFSKGAFQPSRLAFVFPEDESNKTFMKDVQDLAITHGRTDIAQAISRSAFNSWWAARLLALLAKASSLPVLRRLVPALEWRLRALMIS